LIEAESRRVEREPSANSTAVDLVLRGYRLEDGSLRQALEARKLYDEALRRDPRNVLALQARAWTDITELYVGPHADHDRLVQEIDDLSLRAIESDQDDRRTWYIRGFALELAWRWDASLDAFAQVLRLDPQFTGAYTMRAWVLTSMWRVDEAFAEFNNAIAVDPRAAKDPQLLHFRCRTHLLLGHYDDAIHDCELAAARESWFGPRVWLTAAYAQKGELAKAQAAKGELLKRNPGYSIARAKSSRMSDNSTYLQQAETHLYAGLRKAGIPDE
jgi:tetratricopeptide (TPR) repeat protein